MSTAGPPGMASGAHCRSRGSRAALRTRWSGRDRRESTRSSPLSRMRSRRRARARPRRRR